MKISGLPDRKLKITTIKMIAKIRRPMYKQRENFKQRDRKYKKDQDRNNRTEKYNYYTEKLNRVSITDSIKYKNGSVNWKTKQLNLSKGR